MKIFLSKIVKSYFWFYVWILTFFLLIITIFILNLPSGGADADKEIMSDIEIKNELLIEATNYTGACTPEGAARIWGSGLKKRSAALQYTVMTSKLKDIYAGQLENNAPNWVTGVSSPWVESFEIVRIDSLNNYKKRIEMSIVTEAYNYRKEYKAYITLEQEGSFWRITKIESDPQLYAYMGSSPSLS